MFLNQTCCESFFKNCRINSETKCIHKLIRGLPVIILKEFLLLSFINEEKRIFLVNVKKIN
jgi:hypothetical protein